MRYQSMESVEKVWDLMLAHGLKPNDSAYTFLITFVCKQENLEFALQKLSEMGDADLTPTLKTAEAIISLACRLGQPRLAIDIAEAFERSSVRRLDGAVWIECLIASSESLYVRCHSNYTRMVLNDCAGRWCDHLVGSCREEAEFHT